MRLRRNIEAEPLLRRAIEIQEKALGANHPDLAKCLNNLAEVYQAESKYSEIDQESLGPDHPELNWILKNYAELLRLTNRSAEAKEMESKIKVQLNPAVTPHRLQPNCIDSI